MSERKCFTAFPRLCSCYVLPAVAILANYCWFLILMGSLLLNWSSEVGKIGLGIVGRRVGRVHIFQAELNRY